tara:strand:+ start:123 stop:368 length:246 start_codon:yes stop_codon:yes gene_type:complete
LPPKPKWAAEAVIISGEYEDLNTTVEFNLKGHCRFLNSRWMVFSSLGPPGQSAVEQATVNRLAGGSNPSQGASLPKKGYIF